MMNWYVVYAQAQKELVAHQNLIKQGFAAYLPRYRKNCRHARRTYTVMAPLFPRYLFVHMDLPALAFDQWDNWGQLPIKRRSGPHLRSRRDHRNDSCARTGWHGSGNAACIYQGAKAGSYRRTVHQT